MGSSLTDKIITLTIRLGKGKWGNSGYNTLTLSGLRTVVQIENAPLPAATSCVVIVYGMTLSQMKQISAAGVDYLQRNNQIMIQAGDASGMATIYNGEFFEAYPRAAQPDMAFVIVGQPFNGISLTPAAPTSFKGSIDGAEILTSLLESVGWTLGNELAEPVMLKNPYFPGAIWNQIKGCIVAMGVSGSLDPAHKQVIIYARLGKRSVAATAPVISPKTGMIDYPTFSQNLVSVRALFNPAVGGALLPGMPFQIEGSQFGAVVNRTWFARQVNYNLAAQLPDGPWEMSISGYPDFAGA